jgi:Tfp pilus assembly protein PilW
MPIAANFWRFLRAGIFPVLAICVLLPGARTAHADCSDYCQSERYACEESSDSSSCGTQFQICVQNCLDNGTGSGNYGAIAYSSSTGKWGYSYEYDSQRGAESRALAECRNDGGSDDCEVTVWFNQACGALAVDGTGAWGADWAESKREAESKALANCKQYADKRCELLQSLCTN